MKNNDVDEHGLTDILSEWMANYYRDQSELDRQSNDFLDGNILLQPLTKQLNGADLNSLLRGVFALYGRFIINSGLHNINFNEQAPGISDEDLIFYFILGGIHCWEDILETVYISILRNIANLKALLSRINGIVLSCFSLSEVYQNCTLDLLLLQKIQVVLGYGALRFLHHWTQSFQIFISEMDLISIQHSISSLLYDCAKRYDSNIVMNTYSTRFVSISNQKAIMIEMQRVHASIKRITSERLMRSMGISTLKLPMDNKINLQNRLNSLQGYIGTDTTSKITNVNMTYTIGKWNANDNISVSAFKDGKPLENTQKNEEIVQLKESIQNIKLDIFGANSLLDNSDDDDDDENDNTKKPQGHSVGNVSGSTTALSDMESRADHTLKVLLSDLRRQPQPVVADTLSLLIDPYSGRSSDECYFNLLLKIDTVEIARQWTLLDHALFCSIPICSLTHKPTYTMPRYKQQMLDFFSGMPEYGGLRKFIDRFNATSLWISHTILTRANIEQRVKAVSVFIRIAAELYELKNYNGVMAIVSSLQQACITRLTLTFKLLPEEDLETLKRLKEIMAGNKNYQSYRDELARLIPFLYKYEDDSGYVFLVRFNYATYECWFSSKEWKREVVFGRRSDDWAATSHAESSAKVIDYSEMGNRLEAIVPHIGAHLAELTSIMEGNSHYLVDSGHPHLFNLNKLRLISNTLSTLHKLQKVWYNFAPLRCVIAVLNLAAKGHWKYSSTQHSDYCAELYSLSETIESDEIIASYEDDDPLRIRGELFAIPTNELRHSMAPLPVPVVIEKAAKYQPSDAYSRIRKTGMYARNTVRRRPVPSYVPRVVKEEEEDGDDEDEDEDDDSSDDDGDTEEHDDDGEDDKDNEDKQSGSKRKKNNSFFNFFRKT